jgi:proline iminopeptidase
MNEKLKPLKDKNINDSGMLNVGDGHQIYWVDWGNKNIDNPIFYLHGGPGGGFDEKSFDKFNPETQRVIFHDQRGSSRSTPFASIENNTTNDLVEDINKLINHLKLNKISLYGFSWGSTLALVYAIKYPDKVEKMLIGGIFLSRKVDEEFYLQGKIASHFPEVWNNFKSLVPDDNVSVGEYYKKMMFGKDEKLRKKYAKAWMLYESSIVPMDYQPKRTKRELSKFSSESLAYLEAHYILNGSFMDDNWILENVHKIKNVETVIVHGRYDFVCMPSAALDLYYAMENKPLLHFTMSGHSTGETVAREVVKAYTNMLWK